ncbi:Ephrin type-B receptor 1 [Varanus komodoensis]|nr:Ephrin type-B receptor 1 [Varanus komodoensis]
MRSITLSWPQPEQPNGIILDYEIRYYEKVSRICIPEISSTMGSRPATDHNEYNSSMAKSQTNTARIDGLRPGMVYVVQVRARTVAGYGKFSGKMCFQTLTDEHIMRKVGLDESPVGIKIAGRNINNLRYADDTTLMAESEEEVKSLLMWVKEESTKVGLKLNIKKN